ncbi:DUF7619 domain-containing protein [Flavobacterium sp. PLA-1-15]|uniref:DUF7619 domain-containing protein n=1 Tax=Flavobacterium sp. PLA-1-15 TaxID=3380533 RepID=UPI003B822AA4
MKKLLLSFIQVFILLSITSSMAQVGFTCDEPIEITSLPYQHIDDTGNYGNTIIGSQGTSCGVNSSLSFISGNDVIYRYTATHTGFINVNMTPSATRSSVFIYAECSDIGVNCLAGTANLGTNVRTINQFPVVAEEDYYIVLSSNDVTQSYGYNLVIQYDDCPKPVSPSFNQSFATFDGGTFFWFENGSATSWEIAVQEVGDSIPQGNGNYVDTDGVPGIVINDLQPAHPYQFWVRSVCSEGGYSAWVGPVVFNTLICEPQNKCDFTFRMTDSANNGWNGARMQIRQNGIVQVSNAGSTTIGGNYASGAGPVDVTYSLCNDVPFDVFWLTAGFQPQQCVLSIVNSFGQTIFTKPAGVSGSGEVVYSGILNCTTPLCSVPPTAVNATEITTVGATINWIAPGTENMQYEIFVLPSGAPTPTSSSIPTYTGVNGPSAPFSYVIANGLLSYTSYDVYVRVVCPTAELSPVATFTTREICPRPVNLSVNQQSVTTTSATLVWTEASTSTEWDVLLLAAGPEGEAPQAPTENPTVNPEDKYFPGVTAPSLLVENLNPSTIYYFYVRSICEEKSVWSGPFIFNTLTCNEQDKCVYRFVMKNSVATNWNGARMLIRQNGVVVATIGASFSGPQGIAVALCDNVPFDVYWSQSGNSPDLIGLDIVNPYQEIVYTKLPSSGSPLTILYSDATLGNCTAPTCIPPTTLQANFVTATGAQLSWTENGTASQWEIYLAPDGSPPPVNYTPLNTGIPNYYLTTIGSSTFTVTDLEPTTRYTFYVRSICSDTDTSAWTFLQSILFTTIISNDECINAIDIPVNTGIEAITSLNVKTNGSTASLPSITCNSLVYTDVWFKFVAIQPIHVIRFTDTSNNVQLGHVLLTGSDCQSMSQLYCNIGLNSVASGLTAGQTYYVRVFKYGSLSELNITFNIEITSPQIVTATNDEPSTATPIVVNSNSECSNVTYGTINGATASNLSNVCGGTANDDVWFSFVATSQKHVVSIVGLAGTSSSVLSAVYSGTPNSLTLVTCSFQNMQPTIYQDYAIGQTYYIRVWTAESATQTGFFGICVKSISSCENPTVFCNSSQQAPYIIENTTGIPSTSAVACLNTSANPTYFTFQVAQSGKLVFNILQNSNFDQNGNPVGINRDIDFVAWGPFTSPDNCEAISFTDCPLCPNNTQNSIFYPYGNIVDCSNDASYTETLTIQNAVAGEYYIVMLTNFSQQTGYIRLTQTNSNTEGAGSTICGASIKLIAFVDENVNGLKDPNETNFTYGSFTSKKNEEVPVNVYSPLGIFSVFDSNPSNLYDFAFQIEEEYSSYYAAAPTNYNNISVSFENGSQYYFPINKIQDYTDVSVSIVPLTDPRPGFQYSNKIIYKNTGTTAASGTLAFTKDNDVTIVSVGQEGIVNTANGFTYNYIDLLPSETRSFNINMSVPSIPTVNIDDVLTNTVTATIPTADINILNNAATVSQIVIGAYDPNDKIEAHGESIDFNTFTQEDFLTYTIRFQNTGTANAINVTIEDELDTKLDETSVRMISSSHNYTMERTGSKLIWNFSNIQLPPQITHEVESNGYVTFKVKLKPGFALGDIIPNFAEIYFDTNPAIVTNTFNSTFEDQLSTSEFSSGNLLIYPNPSNGMVYINTQNTNENLKQINLYDVLGKVILSSKNLSAKQSNIDVSSLAKGIYMIEITTENNFKHTKKLVVN